VTDLFFRQAVGRLVRFSGAAQKQRAYMFIPDDPKLRAFAFGIAEQRRHSLRKPDLRDESEFDAEESEERAGDPEDQLSLFSAIASVPLDEKERPLETASVYEDPPGTAEDEIPDFIGDSASVGEGSKEFQLTSPDFENELPTPEPIAVGDGSEKLSPRSRKRKLRELNSARVRTLVHRTRLSHAKVNVDLNQLVGIQRITEATVVQLEKRLEAADHWLSRIRSFRG